MTGATEQMEIDGDIWILGGGKFGSHAARTLQGKTPGAAMILVDRRPPGDLPDHVEFVCGDAVAWLTNHCTEAASAGAIVPALPLHLAAEWLKQRLVMAAATPLPDELLQRLPHPLRLSPSQAVLSHADFLCPPSCAESGSRCTVSGRQRPTPLYRLLQSLTVSSFTPLILQSRQLAPGVGGFTANDLLGLLHRAESLPQTPLLIGTACKCHGIIDGLVLNEVSI